MGPPGRVHQLRFRCRWTRHQPASGPGRWRWRSGRCVCTKSERCCACGCAARACGRSNVWQSGPQDRRRYVAAGGGGRPGARRRRGQLTDELIGVVCETVRPHRTDGHGAAWAVLAAHHDQIKAWLVDEGLTVVKVPRAPRPRGSRRPPAHPAPLRPGGARAWAARPHDHVRVADGEPGAELQVDFGRMGLILDPQTEPPARVQALIFTAVLLATLLCVAELPPDHRGA